MRKAILMATVLSISTMLFAQTDSANYFLQKGLDEKTKGRLMESLKQFERAYSYNKTDAKIVTELASTYVNLRRYGQALLRWYAFCAVTLLVISSEDSNESAA